MPTPQYAAYGATKAGIAQVMGSVAAELRENGIRVGVHTLSPGMVLTDLILDGATNRNKQVQTHSSCAEFLQSRSFLAWHRVDTIWLR